MEVSPDWTLGDALLENTKTSRVNEAEFSQPLCRAIQVALVQLLRLWGITVTVTCGHSSGEIAAAYAAGPVTAPEAIVLAYYRRKVVKDINTNGAMLAVGLGDEAITSYLKKTIRQVIVACYNNPDSAIFSGDADFRETMQAHLTAESVFARLLNRDGKAYHSSHMKYSRRQVRVIGQQCSSEHGLRLSHGNIRKDGLVSDKFLLIARVD